MSLFGWLASLGSKKKKGSTKRLSEKPFIPSGTAAATTPKIILAGLNGDKGGQVTKRLGDWLTKISGVEVFRHKKALKLPDAIDNPAEQLIVAAEEGRAWLKEDDADLLVWGEVDESGEDLSLHLLPAPAADGDQAENSGIGETLDIPAAFGEEFEPLFCAAVIGTFGPTFKGTRTKLEESLGGYLDSSGELVKILSTELNDAQAASVSIVLGNAFIAHSRLGGGGEQLERAVEAYREAEKKASRETQPLLWARIQNRLAAVLQTQGQAKKDPKPIRAAALIYSTVGATLNKTANANDWGLAQIHLGKTLYILAGLEGKPEHLQRAADSYEEALSVYDKNSAPARWAEVTNQYGVVLLALGEEMNIDASLEKAVSSFRTAMKIRHKAKTPLLWAQTANNLGAACFALAKRNSENSLLREASDCFEGATEIYRQQGVTKQAQVIEKNLQRVKRLLQTRGG
jgi:tetratricopeptide (TPR) repeat protein